MLLQQSCPGRRGWAAGPRPTLWVAQGEPAQQMPGFWEWGGGGVSGVSQRLLLRSCGLGGGRGIGTRQEPIAIVTLLTSLAMLQAKAYPKVAGTF